MKVALIGANGQLGQDITRVYCDLDHLVCGLNHDLMDISDYKQSLTVIKNLDPEIIINTAAMHNLEACENNPKNAFLVNGIGARNLALISNYLSVPIIHFSTDYVFNGLTNQPYSEHDSPLPINVYGNTKLSGELFIRQIAKYYFIVRVSGLYGRFPCRAKGGKNFVKLMLELAETKHEISVVDDEILSPTYTLAIAEQLELLTRTDNFGIYHMTSEGSCSWYEFARTIFELSNINVSLKIASPNEFSSNVERPKYSVLANDSLKKNGFSAMPHWSESLKHYLGCLNTIDQ